MIFSETENSSAQSRRPVCLEVVVIELVNQHCFHGCRSQDYLDHTARVVVATFLSTFEILVGALLGVYGILP